MIENRISLDITAAQKTDISAATVGLDAVTKALSIVIDKEEIKSLSKLGDIRIPFVEKVAQYAVSNPEFLPPFADVPEFTTDFKAFTDLREMMRPLRQIIDNLENSMTVSGSEAWDFARNYYKTVQFQARMGVPGAQTILDDLRILFDQKPGTPPVPTP